MVSLAATIDYLRAHGLDSLVDAYGVHTYPSSTNPGNCSAIAARAQRLKSVDLAPCGNAGNLAAKPCWITEWGFPNSNVSCPGDERSRMQLVKELREEFDTAGKTHRLIGIDYFAWNSDPWATKQPDADSVYRCGALSISGRLAIAPDDKR